MQRTLRLPTSTLAVHEFGDPGGEPLLFCHGWPASGRQAVLLGDVAKAQGFRIIAPDRPGIGRSPCIEGRRISDWPRMATEIVDAYGLSRIAVLGVSGGGPYALAFACAKPERITSVAIICGAPPIAELRALTGLHPGYRALLSIFDRKPALVRAFFALASPFLLWPGAAALLPSLRFILPRPDAEVLADPELFRAIFECNVDAFRDVEGVFADASLYAHAWGFAPEEIRVPVHFWHGREDANFHWSLAAQLAGRIPGATLCILEQTGHFSAPIRCGSDVLKQLKRSTVVGSSASSSSAGT